MALDIEGIAEEAAIQTVSSHSVVLDDGETAIEALGWALGAQIPYEQGLKDFARAVLEQPEQALSTATLIELIEAKIELLAEFKLEYPQGYAPEDISAMQVEIERLKTWRDGLACRT